VLAATPALPMLSRASIEEEEDDEEEEMDPLGG